MLPSMSMLQCALCTQHVCQLPAPANQAEHGPGCCGARHLCGASILQGTNCTGGWRVLAMGLGIAMAQRDAFLLARASEDGCNTVVAMGPLLPGKVRQHRPAGAMG
jgi:hypothetical protein